MFLSYARSDLAKAAAIAAVLESLGHSVWWDRRVQGGSRFSQEIEQELKTAEAVVVLWSKTSAQSAWVTDEAAEGRDSGRLVPVLLDKEKPPLGFRQYQSIDLSGWKGGGGAPVIQSLHESICNKIGGAAPAKVAANVGPPNRTGRQLKMAVGIATVVMLAALLYLFILPSGQRDPDVLRLQLGQFQSLSGNVPQEVPATFREELLGALATDAVILAGSEEQNVGSRSGYTLTAYVGRTENLLRFTVHVGNPRTGATVWSDTVERPAASLDIAPRQVAVAVSQVLRCGLGGAARYGKELPDATLSIFFNYCEEYWADTIGKETDPTRALDLARRVTVEAPNFSGGWSALAEMATWSAGTNRLVNREALRQEAIRAARRALELDKENSEAYQALAGLEEPFAYAARETQHLKSVTVRPSDCGCEYVGYGHFLGRVGRTAEAADAFKRAQDMIPLSADVNANRANALFVLNRIEEARRAIASALKLWPDHASIREILVRSAFWTGNYDDATKLVGDPRTPVTDQERQILRQALLAHQSGGSVAKASAASAIERLALSGAGHGPLLVTALAALGADREALALASARIQRDGPSMMPVLFQPPMAGARRLPEFANVARRYGLVRYWHESRHLPDFCKEASPPAICTGL